jgi:predicted NUDIX family phosphoesterase
MSEQVLVVKRDLLEPFLASGESLITKNADIIFSEILADHQFVPRSAAEYDFGLKQIIPYVVVRCRNSFLLLRRTPKQTEKRLHNKYSLGIGGHINPSLPDNRDPNVIIKGLYRELNEEILVGDPGTLSFKGVINDESSSVGKVHLGLLYVLEVKSDAYAIREVDKMTGQWMDDRGIMLFYGRMEKWSQIVFDRYISRNQKTARSVIE